MDRPLLVFFRSSRLFPTKPVLRVGRCPDESLTDPCLGPGVAQTRCFGRALYSGLILLLGHERIGSGSKVAWFR
jgi:hypothetical protein